MTARSKAGSQRVGKSPENKNYNRYRDVVPCTYSIHSVVSCYFLFQNLHLRLKCSLNYESKVFIDKITLCFMSFACLLVFL